MTMMNGKKMTKENLNKPPTATVTPARTQLYQSSQRPIYLVGEWIKTSWGRCCVEGRLGQRHADLMEIMSDCVLGTRVSGDGRLVDMLVDPAQIRRGMSDGGYSSEQIIIESAFMNLNHAAYLTGSC